jgi:predicted double-glycine peptidase
MILDLQRRSFTYTNAWNIVFFLKSMYRVQFSVLLTWCFFPFQIFRKEPFFYGQDNYDQLVKIAKVSENSEPDLV